MLNQVRVEQGREPLPWDAGARPGLAWFLRTDPPGISGSVRRAAGSAAPAAAGAVQRAAGRRHQAVRRLSGGAGSAGRARHALGHRHQQAGLPHHAAAGRRWAWIASPAAWSPATRLPERKPHPAPLLLAAAQLSLPPAQCLYVGDAERDVQAARAAGMPVLVARYGYLGPDDDPDSWQPDGQIDAPGGIIEWLDGDRIMNGELGGRVIAITGCTGGLGRAIALDAARAGAELVLLGRNVQKLQGTARRDRADRAGSRADGAAGSGSRRVARDYDGLADAVSVALWPARRPGALRGTARRADAHRAVRRAHVGARDAREPDGGLCA